jgi:DNA-binding MarR family transcriptional regulator
LVVLLAQYGQSVAQAMAKVAPATDLVSDGPVTVLCALDLDGPTRPGQLQGLTGLSSGGVSKLLDRLSEAKLVRCAPSPPSSAVTCPRPGSCSKR